MKRNLTQMQATVITWILMFAIILSFFFISCGTPKEIDNTTMQYELDTIVDRHFIDSVCIADTLAIYPVEWVYSPMMCWRKCVTLHSKSDRKSDKQQTELSTTKTHR